MRGAFFLAGALAVTGSLMVASTAADARRRPQVRVDATPSAVVAAEMALSRLAREKGVVVALLETATSDAVLFTPDMVAAQAALRKSGYTLQSMNRTVRRVLMSCDGALAVASGRWQGENSASGQFVTVWQRQGDGRGRKDVLKQWKWLATAATTDFATIDAASASDAAEDGPELVETSVAACSNIPTERLPAPYPVGTKFPKEGVSADRSLRWTVRTDPDGAQALMVELWDGVIPGMIDLPLPRKATGAAS